jgi:putative spermidine/putrescine transport system permease protein
LEFRVNISTYFAVTKKNPAVINKRWSILKKQGHLKNTAIEGEVK